MKNVMKNPRGFYKYYDALYQDKDYKGEVTQILKWFKEVRKKNSENVLDVGCGTGSHAVFFAERGIRVTGTDIDEKAIKVAKEKMSAFPKKNHRFFTGDISKLDEKRFDLATSLFHVVSYIMTRKDLERFFTEIGNRLNLEGIFVFDCWNGLAALIDPPRIKKSNIRYGSKMIDIVTVPKTNLFAQNVDVSNKITVRGDGKKEIFNFRYGQKLWTPDFLKDTLKLAGFDVLSVSTWGKPRKKADEKDWKIVFVCKEKKNR